MSCKCKSSHAGILLELFQEAPHLSGIITSEFIGCWCLAGTVVWGRYFFVSVLGIYVASAQWPTGA